MQKFILFFLFVLSTYIFPASEIKLSDYTVKQGGFIYVTYPVHKDYDFSFGNSRTEIRSFVYKGEKYALIPVHYSTPPGEYMLVVKEKHKDIDSFRINVTDGQYKKSFLTVSKKMETKRSDENLKKGAEKIREAKGRPAGKLWKGTFLRPVNAKGNPSSFGATRYVNKKVVGYHSGMDFPVNVDTSVQATNSGKVVFAGFLVTTGNTLIIDHGMNLYSGYCHMNKIEVVPGQVIEAGEIVGKSGNTGFTTGPHLHFTISIGTTFVDPALFFDKTLID